ncbi:MAG: hypothetical protein J6U80_02795 [Bacteroidales bacterium]|nr:hypothetical protein [Bacteroidales bacterium]
MKKLLMHCCLVAAVLLVASCVNEEYDLSNVNPEITLCESGLAFPVGSTQKITIKDLLDSSDNTIFSKGEDGTIYITSNGTIAVEKAIPSLLDFSGVKLEDLTYKKDHLYSKESVVIPPALGDGEFVIPDGILPKKNFEKQVFDVEFSIDLPKEIKSVRNLVLNKDAKVEITVSVKDPFISKGSLVPDVDVDLSEFLKIEGVDGAINLSDLALDEKNGYTSTKVYNIQGLNIDFSEFTDKIDIVKKSTISGSISLTGGVTDRATLEKSSNMEFDLVVTFRDITIDKVEANVDYQLDAINQVVDLTSLPEILRSKDVCLDVYNPYIVLDLNTNTGIPLNVTLSLVPYKDGAPVPSSDMVAELVIPASESSDKSVSQKIWIGGINDGLGSDIHFVQANISNFLKLSPDSIHVSIEAGTDPAGISIFDATAEYFVNMDYKLAVPLSFGPDFRVAVSDTIDVSGEGLEDILQWNQVQLLGSVANSLPLQFEIQVLMLYASGAVIPAEQTKQTITSCNKDGSANVSPLDILLAAKSATSLSPLEKMKISFVIASKGVSGVPITDESYLQASLSVKLPEGITLGRNQQ